MKSLIKAMALLLVLLLATLLCSCGAVEKGNVLDDDGNTASDPSEDEIVDEVLEPDTEAESDEPEFQKDELPSAVEVEPPAAAEPKAANLYEIPYETYTLKEGETYTSDTVVAGTYVQVPTGTEDYTYYCYIQNLSDEEVTVYPTISVHAYIGNDEWVGISFGEEDPLDLYIIPANSDFTIQYYPHELPEGTYRAAMYYVTESGEKGYFSFEY